MYICNNDTECNTKFCCTVGHPCDKFWLVAINHRNLHKIIANGEIVMTMKGQSRKQWQEIGTNQVIFDIKCDDDQICQIT